MDKKKMQIITDCRKKLNSTTGATLMVALLFFIMCAVVGSVILAAAASSAGRVGNADTDANRQRYALMSAARFIEKELDAGKKEEERKIEIDESWYLRYITVSFVKDSNDEIVSGERIASKGDFVLGLDQTENSIASIQDSSDNNESDQVYGGIDFSTNSWINTNSDYMNEFSINKDHSVSISKTFENLYKMRDVLAEAVYRNFWIENSKYNGATDDVWNGNAPRNISDWNAQSEYSISVKHIEIDVEVDTDNDGVNDIYPVFADVTMNQDMKLTFKLYCDLDNAGNDQNSLMQMWVISEPDDKSIEYANELDKKGSGELDITALKVSEIVDDDVIFTKEEVPDDEEIEGYRHGVNVTGIYKYEVISSDEDSEDVHVKITDNYELPRKKKIELFHRSVKFSSKWKDCVITTVDPEPDSLES